MLGRVLPTKCGFTNKRCPKCGGNIFVDRDFRGWYEQCLQCGYSSDLAELQKVASNEASREQLKVCYQN
jgi:uncharacterized protein (DUF983 family)